ncbi:hypothetical protein U5903_09440 [Cereibacter johrii]|uniref:hypothetical protein n=1 Tax=Cereibacter johrii TaxID=445629 RepID=UPI002B25CC3D|nr:hypothetical protein [Cereibacter johrii]MEA5160992.1 hypothetical protein [Cereibacter johrii]
MDVEHALRAAATGAGSTPFLADAPLTERLAQEAWQSLATRRIWTLFREHPALTTWATLSVLARNYGGDDHMIYSHLSEAFRIDLSTADARSSFKDSFRSAGRRLGLPLSGSTPTELFFAPLGPARSQHQDLARAFVHAALCIGPPAIEDTAAARAWQRMAVARYCPQLKRLQAAIRFDQSAHSARRFEAWRQHDTAIGPEEILLFGAYDKALAASGRRRADIVGLPRLAWTGRGLAIDPEHTTSRQVLRIGNVPTPLADRLTLPIPWQPVMEWHCGVRAERIPVAPNQNEVLVFDADSGRCLARLPAIMGRHGMAAERLVVLSSQPFSTPSFGPAMPAADPRYHVAWCRCGEHLAFESGQQLDLVHPDDASIWPDAPVLGRAGSKPLLACDGRLLLRFDPGVGGPDRIVRTRLGSELRYATITATGREPIAVPFSVFGFDALADPSEIVFDVLAPGAAGDRDARSELSLKVWIWPGVTSQASAEGTFPCPENQDAARSAGLTLADGCLQIDRRNENGTFILGIRTSSGTVEFHLSIKGERLWRHRIHEGDRVPVPMAARIVLGHAHRHDTFRLVSDDAEADLLVLGERFYRPFRGCREYEIGASLLERPGSDDDRIALCRKDGRTDIFARIRHADDPALVEFEDTGDEVLLSFLARSDCDAVRIILEDAEGHLVEGAHALSRYPIDRRLPTGVNVRRTSDGRIRIGIRHDAVPSAGRATIATRPHGTAPFHPLADASGAILRIGLDPGQAPTGPAAALHLARFLGEPAPEILGGQLERAIGQYYDSAVRSAGAARMAGPLRGLLGLTLSEGATPRHDLVGPAAWLFEAPPQAFIGLPSSSGLSALAGSIGLSRPEDLPDPGGEAPLDEWLDRISADPLLPQALNGQALTQAFRTLHFRLRDSDLRLLMGQGTESTAVRLICAPYVECLERLRDHDHCGGGDTRAVRLVAFLERFARASALGRAEDFVATVCFRTGLSRRDTGRAMTLMIRAGIEAFAYFHTLWHMAAEKTDRTR